MDTNYTLQNVAIGLTMMVCESEGNWNCHTVSGVMVTYGDQGPCVVSWTEAGGLSRARVPISSLRLRWSLQIQSPSCPHQQLGGHRTLDTNIQIRTDRRGRGDIITNMSHFHANKYQNCTLFSSSEICKIRHDIFNSPRVLWIQNVQSQESDVLLLLLSDTDTAQTLHNTASNLEPQVSTPASLYSVCH